MIKAIRTICDSYGNDFILSWAPETFYVQLGYSFYGGINQYCDARAGVYLPMINALRDKTSYVHVQLYNSSPITGLDGTSYNMGTKEGIVAMCEMLLKGFHVGAYYTNSTDESTYFAPLRPDQVVIGVPSSQSAAGSGQVTNEVLQSAFTELNNNYPGIRGIMSWSINWDSSQNKNTFVNENAEFLAKFKNNEPTTVAPVTTQAPTEKTTTVAPVTTQAPTEKATTVVPTTQAPTTVAPTTKIDEDDTIPAPIGLTYAGNKDLPYYFAWQAPSTDIENYNVYVDGVFAGSTVNSSINLTADVFANGNGDYTVSVRSVKNGKMSAATQITYTFKDGTGSKPTTVAPVTTVAPTEKTTTVAPTTVAPTEKATTAVPTTQTPTTQAPTTVAPTTVAPTEKATTVVPTTQTPTTIAPSETGTTTKPETSKETPTVSTTVTTKTAPTVKVPKVKIKKATKKISAKKLKVTLKTAKGVKGYQVMISTSKKFKKAKVKNYKKAKFTIKKLKANKKYFIRVRAYKVVNGKVYYGKWSKRKVKFKK